VPLISDPASAVRALTEFFENRQMLMREGFFRILRKESGTQRLSAEAFASRATFVENSAAFIIPCFSSPLEPILLRPKSLPVRYD